jgi:hypothetical protein
MIVFMASLLIPSAPPSSSTSASTTSFAPASSASSSSLAPCLKFLSLLFKYLGVFVAKVKAEVNAFLIFDHDVVSPRLVSLSTPTSSSVPASAFSSVVIFLWLLLEPKESIRLVPLLLLSSVMLDVQMGLQLIFSFESYVTLGFAVFIRTDEMRLLEVDLKVSVLFVKDVLVPVTA